MSLKEVGFKGGSVWSQTLQGMNSLSVDMPARLAVTKVPYLSKDLGEWPGRWLSSKEPEDLSEFSL